MPNLPEYLKDIPGPSETTDWLTCPTLWRLKQEWTEPGEWKPYIDMGHAVDKAFEGLLKTPPQSLQDSILEGVQHLEASYQPNDDWGLDSLIQLLTKSVTKASETTLKDILATEQVLATQLPLGYARPGHVTALDLLTLRGDLYVITDHKARMTMKDQKWADKEFLEIETDWQLWDYAWRVSEIYGTKNLAIRRHLGRFSPRVRWDLQEYLIKPTVLEQWARRAGSTWIDINVARKRPGRGVTMNLTQCLAGRYGKCKFFDFCHTAEGDPEKAKTFYAHK